MWIGQGQGISILQKEVQATKEWLRVGEMVLPRKSIPIGYPTPNISAENIMQVVLTRLNRLYLCI